MYEYWHRMALAAYVGMAFIKPGKRMEEFSGAYSKLTSEPYSNPYTLLWKEFGIMPTDVDDGMFEFLGMSVYEL